MKPTAQEIVNETAQLYSEQYATLSIAALVNMLNENYPDSATAHLTPEERGNILKATIKEIKETYNIFA